MALTTMLCLMRPVIYLDRQVNPQILRVDQHQIHSVAINLIGK